ncbi:FKBP-type peptidyl-prolyl cis-trans isomerase [Sphingobacterium wenxiniae]|uniref:Peptidyl-prolyl cis-trans isomerase n=1 Tax=Sphingobacterium wenxiniae TaxID=683125 RepID=A0A1I6UDS0_9SPHI|nr:FKBP-type peptidyl-prolyl cis-trans isomerase [Sphingobacterium wenxiniae]SFS99570.1 FKBP-type peptidyl-prolyl cis-trans isomerase [Sphingobacterium wenxiniae]
MKNLFKLLFAVLVTAAVFTSCMKDNDNSWYEEQQKELQRIEATNKEQAPLLKQYAEQYLGENRKLDENSGIWYEVIESPEVPEDKKYEFFTSSGQIYNFALKAKYEGRLVKEQGKPFDSSTEPANFTANGLIPAWVRAIIPSTFNLNGQTHEVGGLTEKGLQVGAKIRIITPSTLGYDNKDVKDKDGNIKIAANSPLDFTIEIVELKRAQ